MNSKFSVICICMMAYFIVQAQDWTFGVDNEGYIHNWLALPAIQLPDEAGTHTEDAQKKYFEKEYFRGQRVATPKDNEWVNVDGKELEWKSYRVEDPCWKFESPVNNSIYFVVTYVIAKEEIKDVVLSIGSDDSSLWLLNFSEVLRIYAGRAVDKNSNKTLPLTLNKGMNVLQAMVINGNGEAGVSARFLDKNGDPVKDIRIATEPMKAPSKEAKKDVPVKEKPGTPAVPVAKEEKPPSK